MVRFIEGIATVKLAEVVVLNSVAKYATALTVVYAGNKVKGAVYNEDKFVGVEPSVV